MADWKTDSREVLAAGLLLRPFAVSDVPRLVCAFADRDIQQWNAGPGVAEDQVRKWLSQRNDWADGSHASWAVGDAAGGLLGSVSVYRIDADQSNAEIGYWTAPWARRRHVAVGAVTAAAAVAFEAIRLHRVDLHHSVDNAASCRVAANAGFALEGHLRESYRYGDGRYHDEHLHARLARDAGSSPDT